MDKKTMAMENALCDIKDICGLFGDICEGGGDVTSTPPQAVINPHQLSTFMLYINNLAEKALEFE